MPKLSAGVLLYRARAKANLVEHMRGPGGGLLGTGGTDTAP